MSFVARETEITESMSRAPGYPGSGEREGRGAMRARSGGRSDKIDPGDAPRSVWQRRSLLKMPRRNAHADAAPSENEALDDGQAQELSTCCTFV